MELVLFKDKTNEMQFLDTPDVKMTDHDRFSLIHDIAQALVNSGAGSINEDVTDSTHGVILVFHEELSSLKRYEVENGYANEVLKKIAEASEKNNDSTFSVFAFSF